jgi:hypothetical protein
VLDAGDHFDTQNVFPDVSAYTDVPSFGIDPWLVVSAPPAVPSAPVIGWPEDRPPDTIFTTFATWAFTAASADFSRWLRKHRDGDGGQHADDDDGDQQFNQRKSCGLPPVGCRAWGLPGVAPG